MLRAHQLHRIGLAPLSFALADGTCATLQGPSGAGKTLLLRTLADLDPHEGEVFCDGVPCSAVTGAQWRERVAYVPAEPAWWAPQIADHFADWALAVPRLETLGLPPTCGARTPAQASTGERQRLALLRAVLQKPRVLLLDEPTGALDPTNAARVEQWVQALVQQGVSVLWVTHDAAQAARVGHQQWTMQPGGHLEAP